MQLLSNYVSITAHLGYEDAAIIKVTTQLCAIVTLYVSNFENLTYMYFVASYI